MAKDPLETVAAGLHANVWLADVGTDEPATWDAPFDTDDWFNLGYIEDPPDPQRDRSTNPVVPWNAPEAIRELLDTETNTMTLKSMQANVETFELYFGPLTITAEGTGARIEPNVSGNDIEKILCLELLDGAKVFRWYWVRCTVSEVGSVSMPRDGVMSFEVTLKRLVPVSGPPWFQQTNLAAFVPAGP